jgi:hypothetical protein
VVGVAPGLSAVPWRVEKQQRVALAAPTPAVLGSRRRVELVAVGFSVRPAARLAGLPKSTLAERSFELGLQAFLDALGDPGGA